MSLWMHEIHERERDGIVILDLKGRLAFGREDSALRQRLDALMESGKKNVILNLQQVSGIDSVEGDSLVLFAEQFAQAGGRLALLTPVHSHATPQELLQLETALPDYTDEQDAVNSFFPDRKVPRYDLLEFLEEEKQDISEAETEEKRG